MLNAVSLVIARSRTQRHSRVQFQKTCQRERELETKRPLAILHIALSFDCELVSLKSRSALNSRIHAKPERRKTRERRGRPKRKELKGGRKRRELRRRRKGMDQRERREKKERGKRDRYVERNDR